MLTLVHIYREIIVYNGQSLSFGVQPQVHRTIVLLSVCNKGNDGSEEN